MSLVRALPALVALSLLPAAARGDAASDLKAFLGGRSGKIVVRDKAVGDKLYLFDLDVGQLTKISDDINCVGPLLSPDGKQVVYQQNGTIYIRTPGSSAKVTVGTGYDPHWWIDASGESWIYYTTLGSFSSDKRKLWWPNNNGVKTYRIRLKDNKTEHLWDWKGSGGPSKDGTYIGAGYATMVLYDTVTPKAWLLYNKTQGCNASMYPGSGKVYLMHLELPHDTFCYRDKNDNRVWFVLKPTGTEEWQNPEWSSDPDYATATAKESNTYYSTWVVKLSDIDGATGKTKSGAKGMLKVLETAGGHDWAEPYLWVAPPPPPDGGAVVPDSGPSGEAGPADTGAGAEAGATADLGLPSGDGGVALPDAKSNGLKPDETLSGGCRAAPAADGGWCSLLLLAGLVGLRRRYRR